MVGLTSLLVFVVIAAVVPIAMGSCPNGCSAHGTCGDYDQCTCYNSYLGNDCSQRTCPTATAFTTTPRGDLNMDGDRYDNTEKLFIKEANGEHNDATILEVDDFLTFFAPLAADELKVGDALRMGPDREKFMVKAVVSASVYQLDHDRNTGLVHNKDGRIYRFLEDIPNPHGTWEAWVGSHAVEGDEGHFYMECANQGICNRNTGLCSCFEGYTGNACYRHRCPNDCSGKGTCETVGELADLKPTELSFTVQATSGSNTVYPDSDPRAILSVGDIIRIGLDGDKVMVTFLSATEIWIEEASPRSKPFGTLIYHIPEYALWDRHTNRACICDTGFTGHDCSLRKCPFGDDVLTTQITPAVTDAERGPTPFRQRNERQTVIMDSMRGAISGTFRLGFTDVFGQMWYTKKISANQRLSGKAFVSASPNSEIVTFAPQLPYGELSAGDFLMIGDERQEILTVYPYDETENSAIARSRNRGGVISSVKLRSDLQAVSTNVWPFRASPAKGIRAALHSLPNKVVPDVATNTINDGTLVGFASGGASTTSSVTTATGIMGDYDSIAAATTTYSAAIASVGTATLVIAHSSNAPTTTITFGAAPTTGAGGMAAPNTVFAEGDILYITCTTCKDAGASVITVVAGTCHVTATSATVVTCRYDAATVGVTSATVVTGTLAFYRATGAKFASPETHGGIAPYDTIRITNAGGISEYLQVKHVDHTENHMHVREIVATGTLSVPVDAVNAGLTGKAFGAIWKAGGYAVTVDFVENSGNLPEMDCDDAGLRAMFLREFTGTVTKSNPSWVYTQSHGQGSITVATAYPYPGTTSSYVTPHKGDSAHLKILAGMTISIGDQTRTVVTDMAGTGTTAGFFVDKPFLWNDASERIAIDRVDYLFYRYPVEHIIDQTTYGALHMSETYVLNPTHGTPTVVYSTGPFKITVGAALSPSWDTVFALGDQIYLTGSATAANNILLTIKAITSTVITVVETLTAATETSANVKISKYDGMSAIELLGKAPQAHLNYMSRWCQVMDQRPVRWQSPDVSSEAMSQVQYSNSNGNDLSGHENRGVTGAGAAQMTVEMKYNTLSVAAISPAGGTFTLASGTTPALTTLFKVGQSISVSGLGIPDTSAAASGTHSAANNAVCAVVTVTATAITCHTTKAPGGGQSSDPHAPTPGSVVTLSTATYVTGIVTISTYHGGLIDPKVVQIGDRLKVKRATSDFETRTVDMLSGTGLDITMISVKDKYLDTPTALLHLDTYAWVDDSGTTESLECGRRGNCKRGSGICACAEGYMGVDCGQHAV